MCSAGQWLERNNFQGIEMAKTSETRNDQRNVTAPTAPQIRAAIGKAMRDVKREANGCVRKIMVYSEIVQIFLKVANTSFIH